MIHPASSWSKRVEFSLSEVEKAVGKIVETSEIHNKTSKQIAALVNKLRFSRYPCQRNSVYNKGSEFKLRLQELCELYGLKHKPTMIKDP